MAQSLAYTFVNIAILLAADFRNCHLKATKILHQLYVI